MPFHYYIPGLRPSNNLEQHLMGIDRIDLVNGYTHPNEYLYTALWMVGLNLLAFGNYYYGFFNRPGADKKKWWALQVLVVAVLVYVIAFLKGYNMVHNGNINAAMPFSESDCHSFAFESAVFSVIASVFFTLLLKWGSRNNRYVPF